MEASFSVSFSAENGAGNRARTDDLRVTNAPLYQLSYTSMLLLAAIQGFSSPAKTEEENTMTPCLSGSVLELGTGFEPVTCGLQIRRSTN